MWRKTGCKCAGRITNCHDGTIMFVMFNRQHHHEGEVRKAGPSAEQRAILAPHMEGGRLKPAQAVFILRENGNHDTLGKTSKNFKKVIKGYLYRHRVKNGAIFTGNVGSMLEWAKTHKLVDLKDKEGSDEHTIGTIMCNITTNMPDLNKDAAAAAVDTKKRRFTREYQPGEQRVILMFTSMHLLQNFERQKNAMENLGWTRPLSRMTPRTR